MKIWLYPNGKSKVLPGLRPSPRYQRLVARYPVRELITEHKTILVDMRPPVDYEDRLQTFMSVFRPESLTISSTKLEER